LSAFSEAEIAVLFVAQPADEKRAVAVNQLLREWHDLLLVKIVTRPHTITVASLLAIR
jgi:hypothetical protein